MDWKAKALAATNGSRFGAIVAAALDETIPAPCYTSKATVTSDGFVMADFTDKDGNGHMGAFVGSVDDVFANAQGLAKHLKLTTADSRALVDTINGWIATDYRS